MLGRGGMAAGTARNTQSGVHQMLQSVRVYRAPLEDAQASRPLRYEGRGCARMVEGHPNSAYGRGSKLLGLRSERWCTQPVQLCVSSKA